MEITTPAPIDNPIKKPVIRKIRFPALETAARAELPMKFPTINESAVLYNCWNRFPMNTGKAKMRIFFGIEPSVIKVEFELMNLSFFLYKNKFV